MQNNPWVYAIAGAPLPVLAAESTLGPYELLNLQGGIQASALRHRSARDAVGTFDGQDMLKVHVQLSGHRDLTFEKRHEVGLHGAATSVLMHDDGVRKVERLRGDHEELSLTVGMQRKHLWEYLDEEQTVVSQTLRSFISRKRSTPRMTVAVPAPQELSAAASVIECMHARPIRRMHVEARILDFFALVLDRFQANSTAQPRMLRVSERDRRLLSNVREFLLTCFTEPPTLHELARRFGINRNKLCTGFQLLFGTTIYDFCRILRLQKAQQLLTDSRLTLTEIAFSAGFSSASAFSTSFARHFGSPPSHFRAA